MASEALFFYSELDDHAAWQRALAAELGDVDFYDNFETGNLSAVRYVLAWNPPPRFFSLFANLSLVINLGAGVDKLAARDDLPEVPVSRLSDSSMIQLMTSYVLFAATRYARDIPSFERAQRLRTWRYIHPRALSTIKIGVLGLGTLGAAAAVALAQCGFDVRGWSRTRKTLPGVACSAGMAALAPFLASAEILVVMLPLTPETRGLLNAERLALLPSGAKLINVSRAAVVDDIALIDALRRKHIAEATLDVFATEPLPPEHPYWDMENVLVTPHIASVTLPETAAREVAESIRLVRQGFDPLHRVDTLRGY